MSTDKYSAETITWVHTWTPTLFSFRLTRPAGYSFIPGQFARLGVARPDPNAKDGSGTTLVWRAYSMVSAEVAEELEFYSTIVPGGEFTTELALLKVGDTVYVDRENYGFMTPDRFEGGKDLWMLATGTGLGPFISMIWDVALWNQYENLIIVHSVRHAEELAYRNLLADFGTHLPYKATGARLHYVPVVTRPRFGELDGMPNVQTDRIPQLIRDGRLEVGVGLPLDLERSRIMICGNPEMVTETRKTLAARGFTAARRAKPGQVAVENYW